MTIYDQMCDLMLQYVTRCDQMSLGVTRVTRCDHVLPGETKCDQMLRGVTRFY